jgi:hypothetical protein
MFPLVPSLVPAYVPSLSSLLSMLYPLFPLYLLCVREKDNDIHVWGNICVFYRKLGKHTGNWEHWVQTYPPSPGIVRHRSCCNA